MVIGICLLSKQYKYVEMMVSLSSKQQQAASKTILTGAGYQTSLFIPPAL
jgi:hypothetical protein